MKKKQFLSFVMSVSISLSSMFVSFADNQYSKIEYMSDLKVAKQLIEENHGNPYKSISKDKLDKMFDNLSSRVTDNTKPEDFFLELSEIIYQMNDGHTSLYPSYNFIEQIIEEKTYFPLKIKFIEDKMYCDILNNKIPLGSEIVKIDGIKTADIMNKLKYIAGSESSDRLGINKTILEQYMYFIYPQYMGAKSEYKITYIDAKTKETKIKTLKGKDADIRKLMSYSYSNYLKDKYKDTIEPLNAEFDTEKSTAILRIYTFDVEDEEYFMQYIDTFFEDVQIQNIKNVIFDVRGNLGGLVNLMHYVLSYVYQDEFYGVKSYVVRNFDVKRKDLLNYDDKEMIKEYIKEDLSEKDRYIPIENGFYSFTDEKIEPASKNTFKGNIYILADEGSFSCGSIFTQKIQELKNAKFVGTETSGNYYKTTAGYTPVWELPNTKIRFAVPLVQLVVNDKKADNVPETFGVKPDYTVKLKYEDYIKGIDTQLQYVYKLIEKNK